MTPPDYRLGLDVGGTNTDAVIMDAADRMIAKVKVPGTPDITGGIVAAMNAVLGAPGADPGRISHVMLGTTHATNAVTERASLRRVAVLRIGGPATRSIRPMFGWPPDLVEYAEAPACHSSSTTFVPAQGPFSAGGVISQRLCLDHVRGKSSCRGVNPSDR